MLSNPPVSLITIEALSGNQSKARRPANDEMIMELSSRVCGCCTP